MKTYLQLKTAIRGATWPDGEAENLVSAHDVAFEEGMADIQKWVPCYQKFNVNTYPACSTWFKCGMTAFDVPNGVVMRVFTIANGEWCDPVFYRQTKWPEPEKWARNLLTYTAPLNVGFPRLAQGFMFADQSTDSVVGRARTGIWAHNRNRVYMAPWVQSNEMVVVEWEGIKTSWADTDPVPEDIDFRTAVKYYLQFAHERDFGTNDEMAKFKALYDSKLADLIHECNERRRVRNDLDYDDTRFRSLTEIADDVAPDPDEMVFAHIGNYGMGSSSEQNVADLIATWDPHFIITSGNNSYSGDYDTDVGQFYHEWIYPYTGAHGDGAAVNLFWPAPGKLDWDNGGGILSAYKAFFRLPNNERYYELVRGDVHFFFLDSDSRDADGNGPASAQKDWLAAKAALSTAAWKVVVMYAPPFSSGASVTSTVDAQWDFAAMEIDLVISAGNSAYERLEVDGVPYIVNGAGGGPLEGLSTLLEESEAQFTDDWGALRIAATDVTLTAEFWDRHVTLRDTLELTK